MNFRLRHLAAALLLHVAIFGILAGGAQCSKKPVRPPPMQGVLLDASRQEVAKERKAEADRKEAEAKKKAEEEKRAEEQRQEEKRQEEKREKEAAEKRKAEELKQKQAADAKKKKDEADKKKKAEADSKRKAEDDLRKKKEQDLKAQKERQELAERLRQEELDREAELLNESANREKAKQEAAANAREIATKQSQWAAQLSAAVARKWTRPAANKEDFKCKVHVLLLPDGSVNMANVVESCGSGPLDKSVEDAVYRASPLPKPADPSIFDRDLIINFSPGNQ